MRSFSHIKRKSHKFSLFGFLVPYMLIYLADSSLTYMLPVHADLAINNKWLLGMVLSLTALGSIVADFVIPSMFKNQTPWQSLRTGILIGLTFPLCMFLAIHLQSILLFALATLISGVYFEFLSFGLNEFMAKFKKPSENERNWGIISIVESMVDTSAAFIGSTLLLLSLLFSPLFLVPLQLLALLSLFLLQKSYSQDLPVEDSEEHKSSLKNFLNEFVVFFRILKNNFTEVLILLVILSFDALIWTYGALWSIERFGQESNWIVTTIYQACMIFGSIFLLKFNFRRVEKGFVTLSIFVAMLVLNLIFVFNTAANADFLVLLVAGSLIFSFGFPLIYSIFTTIAQNNKKEAEEIIGLRRIVYGLSYIIAPIVGGFILHNHTYSFMFGVMLIGFLGISALAFGIYVVQKLLHMNDVLK